MTADQLFAKIETALPKLSSAKEELLSDYSSFHIGGPCRAIYFPDSPEELSSLLRLLADYQICPFILGAGTNLLFPDEGLSVPVISTKHMTDLRLMDENTLRAQAGVTLTKLASFARDASLEGLEFAHGIPGSVGGGVFMNAGAYGGELKDSIVRVDYMTLNGEMRSAFGDELSFGYRESIFQHMNAVVVSADFRLQPGSKDSISEKIQDLARKRREKQPLEYPSAGSAFRRPAGFYAGALIEQAALKGFRIGGAAVSEKHAGFIVNMGGATCADVKELISEVQRRVFESSGVHLEPEIRVIEDQ